MRASNKHILSKFFPYSTSLNIGLFIATTALISGGIILYRYLKQTVVKSVSKEEEYISSLHEAHDTKDYEKQIVAVEGLGNIYQERKEFIKATGLYNYALNICTAQLKWVVDDRQSQYWLLLQKGSKSAMRRHIMPCLCGFFVFILIELAP